MRLIVPLALAVAIAAPVVFAAAKPQPAAQAPTHTPETKKLYTAQCQACHGPDGKSPMKEMAFVDRAWKHGTKTGDIIKTITDGVPGTMMMPFKGRLTEEQIRDLARYVRSLDPKLPAEKK